MRILLVTQWYLPEPQKVVSDLAESLQERGYDVTVLTGFPNYPSGNIYPGYKLRLYQREIINGVSVVRVPLFPDHSRSALKRAINYLSFAVAALFVGVWLIPRVDVVYVIPPLTVGLPAWILSRLMGAPFIYEIQDMWPETLRATGMVRNARILKMVGWYANWVYRRAAAIRVISPGFRQNLIEKGVAAHKIHTISNWVDTNIYHPVEEDVKLRSSLGIEGGFNVMFAGTMGLAQGMDNVIKAASLLRDLPDVRFVLVGDGADSDRLRELTRAEGLSNVVFLGRFPAEEMSSLFAFADVLLLQLRDDPLFRITIPHKTFAYMACGKPVLAAMAGDAADIIVSSDAGVVCPPSNPVALADTVRCLHLMHADQLRRLGENGRRVATQLYSRDWLIDQIAEVIEGVAREHNRRGNWSLIRTSIRITEP